jgi:hypothetical protein
MNINDLPSGSYTPVQPQGGGLNINNLPPGSFQSVQPNQSPSLGGFVGNAVNSVGNLLGGLGNAVMHPFNTFQNLGSAVVGAGKELSNTVGGTNFNDANTESFDQTKNFFDQRYGISDLLSGNVQSFLAKTAHTAYTDPAGLAADMSMLLEGGGAMLGKFGEAGGAIAKTGEAVRATGEAINPFNVAGNVAGGALNLANKGIASAVGIPSKLGYEGATSVLNAAREGGAPLEAMTAAARGGVEPDEFVNDLQKGIATIRKKQLADYQQGIKDISENYRETNLEQKGNQFATVMQNNKLPAAAEEAGQVAGETFPISTQGLKTVLGRTLDNFKIAISKDGELDFSNSPIPRSDYSRVQNMYDDITQWKDTTPEGIKNLQEKISGYFKPLEKANRVNAMVTELGGNIKNYLRERIPEFKKIDTEYSKTAGLLKEFKRDLSLGGKAGPETILKKVSKAAGSDKDLRGYLVDELSKVTGKDIRSITTGMKAQQWTPHGLLAGGELIGSFIHPQLLGALALSSPRMAFEFLRGIGMTENKISGILTASHAAQGALIASRAGSVASNLGAGTSPAGAALPRITPNQAGARQSRSIPVRLSKQPVKTP